MAVLGIDVVCFVVLVFGAFSQGIDNWGRGMSGKPSPPSHVLSWAEIIVGGTLAIHACYAYWRNWIADAGFQGILAIIALLVGFSTMSGSGDGASPPASPSPVHVTTTGGGDYCYSGGQCYIDGEPVSGHP
jgi:hypothetical protein